MGLFLQPADLTRKNPTLSTEDATEIVTDIEALALIEAPCMVDILFEHRAAATAILRRAALRWARAGEGGLAAENVTSGPFSFGQSLDTRPQAEGRLLLSEKRDLQRLCKLHNGTGSAGRKSFTILPGRGVLR